MHTTHTFLFFKPYGVLSQFTSPRDSAPHHLTLSAFGPFPSRVYAAGRLDVDSEGLLLLTDDASLSRHLTDPRYGHRRTYLVQVERTPDVESLRKLRQGGIALGSRKTRPAEVRLLDGEPELPPRAVPIRFRKKVPTAWLEITLTEGMNRQIRRMTAAIGHPTLRLMRTAIGPLKLGGLKPGEHRMLSEVESAALRKSLGPGNPVDGPNARPGPRSSLVLLGRRRRLRY